MNTDAEKKAIAFMFEEISELMSDRDFQLAFFESLRSCFEGYGRLTPKQFESLKKIHERVTTPRSLKWGR